ncbi:hypothetical protein [Aureispira sp. CCB-E]|uniref:hypothetical protein n=1 Tax=Aureispira sp. CCB-E TaxID=3051121 RepID=UPI00286953A5|nr:hypothetical protein [Aureispira sp. CCB-E]WMX16813.1 hypothetical protein QP953_10570 [Aureispira sp. CCB-E]
MKFSLIIWLTLVIVSCNNSIKNEPPQERKYTYFQCLERQIKNQKSYEELKNFKNYLIEKKLLNPKDEKSLVKLFNSLIDRKSNVDSTIKKYNFDVLCKMEIDISDSCKIEISAKNKSIYDSLNLYMVEESFDKVIDLSKKNFSTLGNETLNSEGFQLGCIIKLYQSYQEIKIKDLTSLKLFITTDSIFIEKEYTTLATLKNDLTLKAKEKQKELKEYGFENEATIEMRVRPDVKMGKIEDIKAILQTIEY